MVLINVFVRGLNSSGEILSPWSVPKRTEIGELRKLSFNTEILLLVFNECLSLTNSSGTWRIFRILLIKLWFTSPNVFFKSNNFITRLWCCNLEELIILTRFLYVISILIHLPKDPFKCPTLCNCYCSYTVIQSYTVYFLLQQWKPFTAQLAKWWDGSSLVSHCFLFYKQEWLLRLSKSQGNSFEPMLFI